MQVLLANWKIKVGSLLIALGLFAYVQYTRTIVRTVHVRVERPELPGDLVFAERVPSFINVVVRGPRETLDFDASDFRIRLTNPRPAPGENRYLASLSPDLPEGIRADYSATLSLQLDRVLERELPVRATLTDSLEDGLEIGYVRTEPAALRVRGPSGAVAALSHIDLQTVNVTGRSSDMTTTAAIAPLPAFVELAPNQPLEVIVRALVLNKDRTDLKILTGIPVRCANEIRGLVMRTPAVESVTIAVAGEGEFSADQFIAQVYCPVFFDQNQKAIRPSFSIQDQPVIIADRLNRPDVQIIKVNPARLDLQFTQAPAAAAPEQQEGVADHRLPPGN